MGQLVARLYPRHMEQFQHHLYFTGSHSFAAGGTAPQHQQPGEQRCGQHAWTQYRLPALLSLVSTTVLLLRGIVLFSFVLFLSRQENGLVYKQKELNKQGDGT